MPNGHQRYFCPACHQTFNERFDTLYYHRRVTPEQIRQVLPPEIYHSIGKDRTQRLERTNGIVRQQTGRWHRRQNALWQVMGANKSYDSIGSYLLQLDVAA
jgi:transposase-like protein